VSDCCLTPIQQFSAISWREQVNFQGDDGAVRFVLDHKYDAIIFYCFEVSTDSAVVSIGQSSYAII
jgi:hypothetical protein